MTYDTRLEEVRQKQLFFDQFCDAWRSEYRLRGGTIHCDRGCSGCCSLVVNCTGPEAALVANRLTPAQMSRLQSQIPLIQACANRAVSLKEWLSSYRRQAGPCPFLEQDGSCGVYQIRPLSCRALLATQGPHWCTTDFATLTAAEKQLFIENLDRSAVAFPTHYAATMQEMGQELELAILSEMERHYGYSLLGNLPWLVWLIREHGAETLLATGAVPVQRLLTAQGGFSPYLTVINS